MRARDNPFRTDRVHAIRYRMVDDSFAAMMERLAELGNRGAIIGPKGAGKTTLLEELEPELVALNYNVRQLRLDDRQQSFSPEFLREFFDTLTARDFVLFDGAEWLSRFGWLSFKRRSRSAGGLVVTAHRKGLLPTLKECRTTPEILAGILEELLGRRVADGEVKFLYERHMGNLREALREMYDEYS